ncbi:MAG TPA: beta-galactosidase GalA [Candidatus Aquilonibacter sp.]|nr:beta-galactosidase GalA [Candidatus Aquilonibacter sp.]
MQHPTAVRNLLWRKFATGGRIFILLCFCAAIFKATGAEPSPRERLLMDFDWKFHLGDAPDAGTNLDYPEVTDLAKTKLDEIGQEGELATNLPDPVASNLGGNISFVQPDFDDSDWRSLDLPHDWAVELPFDEKADYKHGFKPVGPGFPQNDIGWYRREIDLPASDKGKILWLEFDGVYRNSLVWLNGHCLGRHLDGYSSFRYDISQFANFGGKNELVVRVDASRFEGWFYEGAGIYRHVWLVKTSPVAIAPDGIFVWSEFQNNEPTNYATIHIQTQLLNPQKNTTVDCELISPNGQSLGKTHHSIMQFWGWPTNQIESKIYLFPLNTFLGFLMASGDTDNFYTPELWSPESPKLYKLVTTVESDGKIVDQKETEFGIRTIAFDATNGFWLNGKPYTIKGTCNHQDYAGVGTALPDALQYYRIAKLKEMGCNAIRTSHNPPTPELLDACDRLGMLVLDENRRMDTNSQTLADLKNFILRDRNHPSVFLWSLGNEEPTQGTEAGERVAMVMQNLVHQLDPTRLCTVAMNSKWGDGFSKVIDVQGFNYHTKNIDAYHAAHPTQPEIGTEVASTIGTRGIYTNDAARGYVSAYGGEHPGWGAAPWEWWPYFTAHPFTSGGFVWTGFDYRGEPTPYKWPCISSQFGIMDTCGFPKDIYYYYQSWWTDKPVLHIAPHWNWPDKIGREILVRVFSNCKEVELFLNGKSLGKQTMQTNQYLDWNVKYEPGVLSAKGYDGTGKFAMETKVETTGAPAVIELSPYRTKLNADGEDCTVVNVCVVDSKGRIVPVADNLVHFEISGPGKIIGVGNGDPSSHEADKADERKVFCGLAQVIVQATTQAGEIKLTATSENLRSTTVRLSSQPGST